MESGDGDRWIVCTVLCCMSCLQYFLEGTGREPGDIYVMYCRMHLEVI